MPANLGAVELGGTKTIVAVAHDPLAPLRKGRIETRHAAATMSAVEAFFAEAIAEFGEIDALGIASFGPIGLRRETPDWGVIGQTTKQGWTGADVAGRLRRRLGCATGLDTDVNAAALAEARWGAGRGLGTIAYLTVGTGIGGGIVIGGRAVHGAMHPEIGHLRVRRHPRDAYRGLCPYHDDCAEALASGPAILERFGTQLDELAGDHPFRDMLADYLGQLCASLVLTVSPERIVIGGGVMAKSGLHDRVEKAMSLWLGGYADPTGERAFIVPPQLGDDAGLTGGFALALDMLAGDIQC